MNRYQFEDLISKYLENELSFSKREEFENYINNDHEAKQIVDQIKRNIKLSNSIKKLRVSDDFNNNLFDKIKSNQKSFIKPINRDGFLFGFKPQNIFLLFCLIICSIFLSNELYMEIIHKKSKKPIFLGQSEIQTKNEIDTDFKKYEQEQENLDTLKLIKKKKNNFSNKIQLVNENK